MGFGSFFTRALDVISPWNRGGEVQRRKKREEEERRVNTPRPTAPTQQTSIPQLLKPQQPTNIFETLNKNLVLNKPNPVVSVTQGQELRPPNTPIPGMVVKPQQSIGNKFRDIFDANTEADKYRRHSSVPISDTIQSNASVAARSAGSVGSNLLGGLIGMAKGVVELPSFALKAPQLVRFGAAKLTGNKQAEQNIANDKGVLSELARKYEDFVSPVTRRFTGAEQATDRAAERFASWTPSYAKPVTKGLANIIPVDAALAGLTGLSKVKNTRRLMEGGVEGLDDVAMSASVEATDKALTPRPIPVKKNIPVDEVIGDSLDIPVQVNTPERPQGPIIRELGGDARSVSQDTVVAKKVADIRQAEANLLNSAIMSDRRIEGVRPRVSEKSFVLDENVVASGQGDIVDQYAAMLRDMGEGNGVVVLPDGRRVSNNVRFGATGGKRMSKAAWREEAERQLRTGKADPSVQKAFDESADPEVQALLSKGEQPDIEPGRSIKVQKARGIPVRDETVVPQNLPETPGKVRVTTSTAPSNAKSEAVAAQAPATILPKETQAILDNPKQYNKRQVAAARNQRKLARQMAKTQEDTAAAMERIQATKSNPVEGQPEGFAPTGEFKVGKRGNVSETAHAATEAQAGTKEMADRSVDDLLDEISVKDTLSPGDRRRITAAKENLMQADPEGFRSTDKYKLLNDLEKASRSDLGRGLALIPRTIRKSANSDALTGRWERKVGNVLDDPSKMTDVQLKQVQGANDAFTTARDRAGAFEEQFRKTGSEADFKAWEQAHKAARDADTSAKMIEIKVAQDVLKGEKGANVTKTIDAMKKEADVNTMDFVTANMLSGTGTGFRNTFGTELSGVENRVGANLRAKVTKGIFGENVGGFDRGGAKFGRKVGASKWMGDSRRRAEVGSKNPVEWAKNWATTINSAGESSMQSQVYSRLAKYYKNQFADQGVSGKELDLRMRHAMITDPDNMADTYLNATMKSSGLTGLFEKGQTIEKAVTNYVGRQTDSKIAQGASKLIMRMAVGFPTATTNFLYQSAKRLTVGLPSYIEAGVKAAKGDKMAAALAFERGMKETGSGGAILGLGVALGSSGVVSGAYPDDKDERARWEREGISENSIKIGGAWYPIPQGAGMFGLPLLTGAAIGRDGGEGLKEMYSPGNLSKLLPTDQIQGFLNMMSGDGAPQDLKNMLASSVRAGTPVGALFNQIAKSFDPTKNDTTTKDFWSNVLDQVYSGVPGVNNAMGIPDKTDKEGNPVSNPNAAELAFGAASDVQAGGEQRSQEVDQGVNSALSQIDKYGLLSDSNMDGVLEGTALEAFTKAKSGKQLDESDIKALKEGLVKGVSSEGTDTAYLERGEYDTNLAVLQLKRDLMKEDKTTKPSSLKDVETAIKRGQVYKDNKMPYEDISNYKSIGVGAWRNMGDPEHDDYDPDMYQKLWQIDQTMTKAGVSYKRGALDENKYFVKKAGSGGSRKIDTSFGTLKVGGFAPRVQQYETIGSQSGGGIPRIGVKRPNIRHQITSSR